MVAPQVSSGVEEWNELTRLRIDPGDIRTFVKVTVKARERKVVRIAITAVLPSDDMLDMEGCEGRH